MKVSMYTKNVKGMGLLGVRNFNVCFGAIIMYDRGKRLFDGMRLLN